MNAHHREGPLLAPREPRAEESGQIVVEARGFGVEYRSAARVVPALEQIHLQVRAGERLGLVGESGSGKSTLGSAIGRLLPASARTSGSLRVAGLEITDSGDAAIRELRRSTLGFIPQDPIASLDPTMRVGRQLALAVGLGRSRQERAAVSEMLDKVLIREPERVARLFPHQLSGGMAQRVAIAMATARKPGILVADEPTAALDSLVRDEVLRLIFQLADDAGATVLWLSHDLSAVARWCDRVAVMSRGRIVEHGVAQRVLSEPTDAYTQHLVAADPRHARFVRDLGDESEEVLG
jgi:peptide/nickel transport system ATP-binding protein